MRFFEDCWSALLTLTNLFSFAPEQKLLGDIDTRPARLGRPFNAPPATHSSPDYIAFPPPHLKDPETDDFECKYEHLSPKEWRSCSTPNDRSCWLEHINGTKFDIHTDYEKVKPPGTTRVYNLAINRAKLNQDGVEFPYGVVFDDGKSESKYPGPWIRACWGDKVIVNVYNNLTRFNGSTVHWHGIRQLNTMQYDGVNAITQCPIAPGSNFTYEFDTWQYGTSWYHSHYSMQYGDGLVGPLTIYGPSSADWDEAKKPTLMTDWNHRSAFQEFSYNQETGPRAAIMDSILLNGIGNYAGMAGPKRYNLTFEPGKRYLMRIINTSVDTTFIFSIDNHTLEVMSSDFVPIKPYNTSSVLVGIGQRYHLVAHAHTAEEIRATRKPLADQNFWIRTIPADSCSKFELGNKPDERQGVLRYQSDSTVIPRTARGNFPTACSDENATDLHPVVEWQVGDPWKKNLTMEDVLEVAVVTQKTFGVDEDPSMYRNFTRWTIGPQPLWLNFSNPSVKQLWDPPSEWDKKAVVIPEDAPTDSWVYLLIIGNNTIPKANKITPFAAHPIHLHGHDFAILRQSNKSLPYCPDDVPKCQEELKKLMAETEKSRKNPPRRDVALLPAQGHLLIAFKADNPGIWLMHCHIAFHASSGLALQILERQNDIPFRKLGWFDQIDKGCANWTTFYSDPNNLWSSNYTYFQDDSGI